MTEGYDPHDIEVGDIISCLFATGQFIQEVGGGVEIAAKTGGWWGAQGCERKVIPLPIGSWILVKKCGSIGQGDSECYRPPNGIGCPGMPTGIGTIEDVTWVSRNPHTGEPSDVACYGEDVTVDVTVLNPDYASHSYVVKVYEGVNLMGEAQTSVLARFGTETVTISFAMPEAVTLPCMATLELYAPQAPGPGPGPAPGPGPGPNIGG